MVGKTNANYFKLASVLTSNIANHNKLSYANTMYNKYLILTSKLKLYVQCHSNRLTIA